MESKLNHLMTVERLYTDPDLSLNILAQKVDLSLSQLSEYLNSVKKVNFHQYVGRYRIEAAQKLLGENNRMSVIEIAFEVGYNTLSRLLTECSKRLQAKHLAISGVRKKTQEVSYQIIALAVL
ncbi:MAG: helix-turn-helix domain-containing protein [Turneriella sp.]